MEDKYRKIKKVVGVVGLNCSHYRSKILKILVPGLYITAIFKNTKFFDRLVMGSGTIRSNFYGLPFEGGFQINFWN